MKKETISWNAFEINTAKSFKTSSKILNRALKITSRSFPKPFARNPKRFLKNERDLGKTIIATTIIVKIWKKSVCSNIILA